MNFNTLLRYLIAEPVQVSLHERMSIVLAAFIAILSVSLISSHFFDHHALPWFAASMGASAVILFALPSSPMAQPWPFIGSHLIAATVGITCVSLIDEPNLAVAMAIAVTILLMFLTHTLHPPGGASALLPIVAPAQVHAAGYHFLLYPMLPNVLLLLLMAVVLNRWLLKRRYPLPPYQPRDERHHHNDPSPLEGSGVSADDLHATLASMDGYLDISEEELAQIYKRAGLNAMQRHMGEMCCEQIMSKDVIVVQRDTTPAEAWELLQYHHLRVLPVIDANHLVVGVISAIDILNRVGRSFLLSGESTQQPAHLAQNDGDKVAEIMTEKPVTVALDTPVTDLVPLFSERGYHHLPVVDHQQRLIGMVTQSDLIGALYASLSHQP